MPLTQNQLQDIKTQFKLQGFEGTAMLGAALRRACVSKIPNYTWPDYIGLVIDIAEELNATDPNEISKQNSKGLSAIGYAIKSLIEYSKTANPLPLEIHYRLSLISAIANYLNTSILKINLSNEMSDKYIDDPDKIYYDFFTTGIDSIPVVDQTIIAINLLLASHCNRKNAYDHFEAAYKLAAMEDIQAIPAPIVLLTQHNDSGIPTFFKEQAPELICKNYKLLCVELPSGDNVSEFINEKEEFVFRDLVLGYNANKPQIFKDAITSMQNVNGSIEFIDPILACKRHQTALGKHIKAKYNMTELMITPRNIGMLCSTLTHMLRYKCGGIMLVGIYHYHGLREMFPMLWSVNPKFVVLTENKTKLFDVAEKLSSSSLDMKAYVQNIIDAGETVFDTSVDKDLTKLWTSNDSEMTKQRKDATKRPGM